MAQVQLTGYAELDAELKRLSDKIKKKILNKMVREGAKIVQRGAIARAPTRRWVFKNIDSLWAHSPGLLKSKRGIIIKRRTKKQLRGMGMLNAVIDSVRFSRTGFYGAFVEIGHWVRVPKKGKGKGRLLKWIPPNPMLRPALDNNQSTILNTMRRVGIEGIKKYRPGAI